MPRPATPLFARGFDLPNVGQNRLSNIQQATKLIHGRLGDLEGAHVIIAEYERAKDDGLKS